MYVLPGYSSAGVRSYLFLVDPGFLIGPTWILCPNLHQWLRVERSNYSDVGHMPAPGPSSWPREFSAQFGKPGSHVCPGTRGRLSAEPWTNVEGRVVLQSSWSALPRIRRAKVCTAAVGDKTRVNEWRLLVTAFLLLEKDLLWRTGMKDASCGGSELAVTGGV